MEEHVNHLYFQYPMLKRELLNLQPSILDKPYIFFYNGIIPHSFDA